MLFVDGIKLDLKSPKTDTEKEVSRAFEKIKMNYRLASGRKIHFTYPKKLVVPNRHDPTKMDTPRGFRIRYKTTLHTPTGTETWVYAKNTGRGKNGEVKYLPSARMFYGDMLLGISNIDEIFYLLYKYSRTEGGFVQSSLPKFIAIQDEEVEASLEIEKTQGRILMESVLYLPVKDGGLSDESVKRLANRLRIPDVESKVPVVLRKETLVILKKTVNGSDILRDFLEESRAGSKEPPRQASLEVSGKILDAESKGVVAFYKGGKGMGWRYEVAGSPDGKLMTVQNETTRYEELVSYLMDNPEVLQEFNSRM